MAAGRSRVFPPPLRALPSLVDSPRCLPFINKDFLVSRDTVTVFSLADFFCILLAEADGIGRTVAADNGAFEVGRPACIGPGAGYEQVGDGAALDGPVEFGSWSEREDGMGNRSPAGCRDVASGREES